VTNFLNFLPFVYFVITAGLILGFAKIKQLIKPAVILILFLKIAELILKLSGQYSAFKNNPISQFLLPPYQRITGFFFHYVDYRFIWPIFFSILVGFLFFLAVKLLNRFSGGRFFEEEETWMIFYSIIFVGHPLWIVYIFAIVVMGISWYLIQLIFKKIKFGERLPLYYLWLPLAILTFFFQGGQLQIPLLTEFLNNIKF